MLLNISLFFCKFFINIKKGGIVIGVEEVASMLYSMGGAIKGSKTVSFYNHSFYEFEYDYDISKFGFIRYIIAPLLLGYLVVKYKTFIYISGNGYLIRHIDGRMYEFEFLRKNGCKIVCYFTGSDIRSFNLMEDFSKKNQRDVITTYQHISHKGINSIRNEKIRYNLAASADKYASAIFNAKVDGMSYITGYCHPFLYFAKKKDIRVFPLKFKQDKKIVLHAPSSPIIKGTPIVRAAIKQLREEGYDFDYVELSGVPHTMVLEELSRAHIVLNEFYALSPGVFGVEAMMNNAVLLTSADRELETTLFEGANDAWLVTPYWKVYENLKFCLESSMEDLKFQADKGTKWVECYCSDDVSAAYINNVIDKFNA